MIQGSLKRKLKKQRLKRNILSVAFTLTGCIIVVLCLSFGLSTQAKSKVDNADIVAVADLSEVKATAGASLAIRECTVVAVERTNLNLVTSANLIENLIAKGTEMYASTNLNARVEPSKESVRVCGIPFGNKVEVISDTGMGWVKVLYKNKEVYVCTEYLSKEAPMKLVSSTAYWDKYNRTSASGRELVEGYSVAGKVEWLHKRVNIYACNSDGTVGAFLGTYRFDDTGYGQESGVGDSKILEGRTIGTIENGTCIDFYMENENDCWNYGRRNVYIQIIE